MAEINFDLENAQCELEQAFSLLGIFQDFYIDECPAMSNGNPPAWVTANFADRTHQYIHLIGAAQDTLNRVIKGMGAAIESYYHEARSAEPTHTHTHTGRGLSFSAVQNGGRQHE